MRLRNKSIFLESMNGRFLLNDKELAYLIHGQPLKLEYHTEGCWFIVISYNNGASFFKRLFFKKANGIFETVTNVYSPVIKLWGIGWGVKKLLHHRFRINFFNTRTQMMYSKTPDLKSMPTVGVRRYRSKIHFPSVEVNTGLQPLLVNNQLHIQSYDDFMGYKQHHPKYQTIK